MRHYRSVIACLAFTILGLPITVYAEYTVKIENMNTFTVGVHYDKGNHRCISDPGRFNKEVSPLGTVEVHAKWDEVCNEVKGAYISVCRDDKTPSGNTSCAMIIKDADMKRLYLEKDGRIYAK